MSGEKCYTVAIIKGAALLEETRTLLYHWRFGEPPEDFARRVEREGILGKATARRVRDTVRQVFIPRYLKPNDRAARVLKIALESNLQPEVFKELVLLYSARNDILLREFIVNEFWPTVRRGKLFIDVSTVLSFLSQALVDGKMEKPWSNQVSKRVANGLLCFLTEVGFARAPAKGRRELVNYRMSDEGICILARILKEEGVSDSGIVDHEDWNLFGMERGGLLFRFHLIGEEMGLLVQQAGSVVSFNWRANSVEDLINMLSKNRQRQRLSY